ncbi:MAG TPA: hypothetical protein VFT27_02340, partial [Actinomycetota bacterium]|nr:hypothetical protein [Actinomycetota bacterium]
MWGPGRKGRRLRRAGATFSLIGLVMTVFLAIGQVGLIAANADGWSDRSGDGSASAESGRGDGFTKTVDTDRVKARQTEAKQVFEAAAQQDSLNVNLDQYANQDAEWQNGNLNGNNSQYAEGDVVPFRLAIEGLTAGSHTIHINYDFTAGGHEAYDFLATWDVTETPGLCDAGGGGVSSMCPGLGAADTQTFPSDPFAPGGTTQAGLTVAGAEAASGVSRQLTMYGGTITSITGPVHSGPTSGNSTGDFTVTFNSSDSAVLLAWGGHLAESTYWKTTGGDPNGAAEVSGSPWHMRTQQLDGSGNKNQDRSIQPSAIFRPSVQIFKEVVDATGAPITEVSPGESFTYQILVTNGGNADATGVVVTDDLANSLTVDSATWEVTGGSSSACTVGAGNTIRCPAGSGTATIPAGDSMLVVIDVTAPNTCGPLLNTAHVDWNEAPTEAGLDSSQVTVDVTGCAPELTIDKEAVDAAGAPITEVSPGDSFSYVITVTNDGNADATGVVVTDDLDNTLTIDSASYAIDGGASSDCDIASG